MERDVIVVDAEDQILGRMASHVAKLLLNGHRVVIVNAAKAVLSGDKYRRIEQFKERYRKTTLLNPETHGHRNPRRPENIVRRAVRGMLPRKKPRGREAYKRLRVYPGVPERYREVEKVKFEDAMASRLGRKYVYLGEIAMLFGWRPPRGLKIGE